MLSGEGERTLLKDLSTLIAIVGLVSAIAVAWEKLDGRVSALDNRVSVLEDWGGKLQARVTALEARTQTPAQAPFLITSRDYTLDPLVERCLDLADQANVQSSQRAADTRSIMASLNCGALRK
jgi:hypothetical protein